MKGCTERWRKGGINNTDTVPDIVNGVSFSLSRRLIRPGSKLPVRSAINFSQTSANHYGI